MSVLLRGWGGVDGGGGAGSHISRSVVIAICSHPETSGVHNSDSQSVYEYCVPKHQAISAKRMVILAG